MPQPATRIAALEPGVDHARGPAEARVVVEYGDYECPYSRAAFRAIERVERRVSGEVGFAFRHFPLASIHPHAVAAAGAAEAAALQDRFWEMSELLFHNQSALEIEDLRGYAQKLDLDLVRFESDRISEPVARRVERDVQSAIASGKVTGTPTLFIDGVLHNGGYDTTTLLAALAS
jgi:protein-disulfide isomerase